MSKNKKVVRKFPLSMNYYGESIGMQSLAEDTRNWRDKIENEMDEAVKEVMGTDENNIGLSIRAAA